eukprot:scaffold17328_cov74-Cyclotella_meneghiniana.AAC.5
MSGQRIAGRLQTIGNWRIDHQHQSLAVVMVVSVERKWKEWKGKGEGCEVFGTDLFGGQISFSVSPG